jgi:peptidoglycan/xylan/chitin deacetylase (PgdA/CDA1 family)
MKIKEIVLKLERKLLRFRLQPVRVFCFHEVGENEENNPDRIPMSFLMETIQQLLNCGYEFISLEEAHAHIKKDKIRIKKYAVLTADDGLKCQLNVLEWLEKKNIPITLCLNVLSLNNKTCGLPYRKWYHIEDKETEKRYAEQLYISESELQRIESNLVTFALHGVNHDEAATEISLDDFKKDVETCMQKFVLNKHYVPYYTYKYGMHNRNTDEVLRQYNLTPILVDGEKNYNDASCIHRELLEALYRKCQQK